MNWFLKISTVLTFILVANQLHAQIDSLNKLTKDGKKDGYWIVYLDSTLRVTDSTKSFFYAYNLYDSGAVVFDFGVRSKPYRGEVLTYTDTLPAQGKPVLLNGTFIWKNVNGRTSNTEIYSNGHPLYWQSISYSKNDPDNPFKETIYFDRLYKNIPGTFYYTESTNYNLTEYWFYEDENGKWSSHKIK